MDYREEKIAVLEALLERHMRTRPYSATELVAALPELRHSLTDVTHELMSPAHDYALASCYVHSGDRQYLGYRLQDRDQARELVARLREQPRLLLRRARPSALAGA